MTRKMFVKTAFTSKSKHLYSAHFFNRIIICFIDAFTNKLCIPIDIAKWCQINMRNLALSFKLIISLDF
jgi:hypothetical protein